MINLSDLTREGKALFLAYDQGMEHGPSDFDDENADPQRIIDIGLKGEYTGIIFQKGIAEKYYKSEYQDDLPLILKLNGKTNLNSDPDPYSPQICTVEEAIEIGAQAVGYTIYVGSKSEPQMFKEFSNIEREAHAENIPVIGWMYIRGSGAEGKDINEITAYAARLGLELGADIIKIKHPGDNKALKWAIQNAGKTKVVISGGVKDQESNFLDLVRESLEAGAIGMAVGRNIWQAENPEEITEKVKDIIWH
jgi:fructose-bisphosphate aldolase, class I